MMLRRLRSLVAAILHAGAIPQHVAFIMDGNRRFADRACSGNVALGHTKGFGKLLEALEWCSDLGIQCVSVYAFSVDNFKRSPAEVAALMKLAEIKLHEMLKEEAIAKRYGVQIRVIGNLALLPEAVQQAAQEAMERTKHHKNVILNICLAYSSTLEMECAMAGAQARVSKGDGDDADAIRQHFEKSLYTEGCPPVDLLVRTSGECRLSDFLLWQSSHAMLHFTPVLWPDFTFMHLLQAVVSYQKSRAAMSKQEKREANDSATFVAPLASEADRVALKRGTEDEVTRDCRANAGDDPFPQNLRCTEEVRPDSSSDPRPITQRKGKGPVPAESLDMARVSGEEAEQSQSIAKPDQKAKPKGVYLIAADSQTGGFARATQPALEEQSSSPGREGEDAALHSAQSGAEAALSEPSISASQQQLALSTPFVLTPPRRHKSAALDRRKRLHNHVALPQTAELDSLGMFCEPGPQGGLPSGVVGGVLKAGATASRTEQLRQNGFAGGYDSMDDEEDADDLHVNGCPCCIVKFLPMHRICTEPTPAIAAMRQRISKE